ncbi:hypothetical protein EST38_g4661 [Candolleomyces aberdarensis]|uniref:HMG box domain-containing protein n=1 Tax=Candolleomyces aberdarensis TaxID=2316362 RepID=A0A4Q2DQE6_9AGAR|nr:hypothetical protein EST38_g4661 [Candolleomyces aberdarensis]
MQAAVPGHQLDHYIRVITQTITRSTVQPRKHISKWNTFLAQETRKLNKKREPGAVPIKTSDVSKELSAKWKAMSAEEQEQYTEDMVQSLAEAREAKESGQHNSQMTAFHDVRAVVEHIQREIVNVNQCTGTEFLFLAVRKDIKRFNAPYILRMSDLFDTFFHNTTKFTLTDLVLKLESFFIGGVDGLAWNYLERLVQLKSLTAALIKEKLNNATGHQISRMVYTNFDEAITLKHGVVIKGWPLSKFCCPSHITSCSDVELLYNAWQSGATHFVKLSNDEYGRWRTQYLQHHAAAIQELPPINSDGNGQSATVLTANTTVPVVEATIPAVPNPSENAVPTIPTSENVVGTVSASENAVSAIPPASAAASTLTASPTFMNFGIGGAVVPPKARKTRKEKGVPRGSRKGKGKGKGKGKENQAK